MNLIFYVEARYIRDDAGNIYNAEGVLKFPLWERYLEVFDSITIVARVKYIPGYLGDKENIANGSNVSFFELPHFFGPLDFLKKRSLIYKKIKDSTKLKGAFLMRVPGQIGTMASKFLFKYNIRYGLEIVGDPFDVFSKGAVNHPLRLFFKYKYYLDLKKAVSRASSVLYVTEKALQNRYPVKSNVFSTVASNVILKEDSFRIENKIFSEPKRLYQIISIGSLEQMYKAPDIMLRSIKIINDSKKNYNVKLIWIGAGKYLTEMEEFAKKLNISEYVDFIGYLSDKNSINKYLDSSDIFVLASRTEGLPRVIIEAMARGLPIVGTNVGGIPELISDNLLVEKNDPESLARKIQFLIDNPHLANIESERNLKKSSNFSEAILTERRKTFYNSLHISR